MNNNIAMIAMTLLLFRWGGGEKWEWLVPVAQWNIWKWILSLIIGTNNGKNVLLLLGEDYNVSQTCFWQG